MVDRYGRAIEVGDIILAKPMDNPERRYVVGTVSDLAEHGCTCDGHGWICVLSTTPHMQVDRYEFLVGEAELIISKDGTLAHARTVIEVAV